MIRNNKKENWQWILKTEHRYGKNILRNYFFLTCCSTLFMLSIKSSNNHFETASSSSSYRIFFSFISSWSSYSSLAAAPPPSTPVSVCVSATHTHDTRVHSHCWHIASPLILSGHICIITLLPHGLPQEDNKHIHFPKYSVLSVKCYTTDKVQTPSNSTYTRIVHNSLFLFTNKTN